MPEWAAFLLFVALAFIAGRLAFRGSGKPGADAPELPDWAWEDDMRRIAEEHAEQERREEERRARVVARAVVDEMERRGWG